MPVLTGVMFHAIGASSASLCYTPQKKVTAWSWQTYWMAQAAVCWFLLPLIMAWFTIPQLPQVLQEAPTSAMLQSFFLGLAYGIGGTAFGIAIRYVGFSLTYSISVGISCVLGTLLPLVVNGTLSTVLSGEGAGLIISGISMGAVGIAVCGMAGRSKEQDIEKREKTNSSFSLSKGLPLCLLAGVLSALYGYALSAGQPIADTAAKYGAGNFQGNVIYIFANTGAFISTALYCLYLHSKNKTMREYVSVPGGVLATNYLMAILTGFLWYGQFFFYGLGHVRMGNFKFSSWAIHMIMLVLLSTVTGLLLKEWKNTSKKTINLLAAALIILIVAVILLTFGNQVGGVE
ncbi:MAG TPA: L-rhamnose/proton symporter RhaT [Phnomibacter sp.]|nr:L-rhamnose/proton symporter RhaT [Phnomibacter sp.]